MERFKIEHFERDNPGKPFPAFTSLEPNEWTLIQQRLKRELGLSDEADDLMLVATLLGQQNHLEGADAEDDDFQLGEVFQTLAIEPEEQICINWYRFDRIDRMAWRDVAKYFDDIWYPGPDDIDLFDSTLSWIVSIDHEGYVFWRKFSVL